MRQQENDESYDYRATGQKSGQQPSFKLPYVLPYVILLIFNGLLFGVNYIYSDLQNGAWSPFAFSLQPQNLKQRPYEVVVYVLNSVSTFIFLLFMMMKGHQKSIRTEKGMIARWFLHLIAISLIVIVWILDASQLWVYKISLNNIAFNSNWVEPLYTILYSITVAYGILLAFPASIYLLYRYFIKAQDNYKINREAVPYHKIFNKICTFATYISIIIVIGLNLSYLNDYENYLVSTVYVLYPYYPNLETEMLLPVLYTQYILSGMSMVFAAFLLIKQVFDTMKNKRKHIRRQLIVLTTVMFLINVLTINKFIEINRYQKVISVTKYQPTQPFLTLYYHLRVILWCYIFLIFPLNIYSIRNLWIEWKNEFSQGETSELSGSRMFEGQAINKSNLSNNKNPYKPFQTNPEPIRRQPSEERKVAYVHKNQEAIEQRQPSYNNTQGRPFKYQPNKEVKLVVEGDSEVKVDLNE